MSILAERLLEVHRALDAAGMPHAFGGAIALAYCTEEPRGTRDLDVNVFVDPRQAPVVLASLPPGVSVSAKDIERAIAEGQVRVWWEETPIDIFLDIHSFHEEVERGVLEVSFVNEKIPVLDGTALTVFKALFDRTKDWADIEEIVAAGALDMSRAIDWLQRLQGEGGPAAPRLAALANAPQTARRS
ncbi:MAG TPA: hypothetical protein VGF95_08800 [Solirubrobacteraceae bacterium]|jgi:hypothetical protein